MNEQLDLLEAPPTRHVRPQAATTRHTPGEGELRVVTLTEPYATLMMLRAKRLETRSGNFARNYRGECAVQAAKGWPRLFRRLCALDPFYPVLRRHLARKLDSDDPRLGRERIAELLEPTLGHIIALGEIAGTFWTDGLMEANRQVLAQSLGRVSVARKLNPQPVEEAFGDYGKGRLAIEFRQMRALRLPVPVVGNLGLWKASEAVAKAVRELALNFEDETARNCHRASGAVRCELCGRDYHDHPDETELLSDQGRPFLVRDCNGELLKL